MSEYKELLKHLGIKPELIVADMRSRLPDSEKPMFISRCKKFEVCKSAKNTVRILCYSLWKCIKS